MGDRRCAYRVLVRKPEGRAPLRSRLTYEDNIKEIERKHGVDGSGLRLRQAAGFGECGNKLSGSTKCGEFVE